MTDKYYICDKERCKVAFPRYQSLAFHYVGKHRGEKAPPQEECEVEEIPEGYTLKVPEVKEEKGPAAPGIKHEISEPVYRQVPEPSSILQKILSEYPDLPKSITSEVMSWVEYKGTLHPMEVRHLLTQMAGVPKGAAEIISQKYQLAMQKAALEGNAEVQMTIAGWQYGPQLGPESPLTIMPNMPGQPPRQPFMPAGIFQPGLAQPPQYPYGPYYPQYGYPYPPYQPPLEKEKSSQEVEERFSKLEEKFSSEISKIGEYVGALSRQLTETEEKKRQEALDNRLASLEEKIITIASTPKGEETSKNFTDAIKEIQSDLAKVREEAASARMSSLEDKISNLTTELSKSKEDEIARLRADLADTKRLASDKPPVTGRTEMDVVGNIVEGVVEKLGEAGKDVRAIALSGRTREEFNPTRKPVSERSKVGEKLANVVEKEAALSEKENQILSS